MYVCSLFAYLYIMVSHLVSYLVVWLDEKGELVSWFVSCLISYLVVGLFGD